MSIGERIVALRTKQNITQAQLAKILDISRQAVSKWESDLSAPDTLNLIKLADVLDTDVEYLATGKPSPSPLLRPPVVIKQVETVEKIVEKEKLVRVEVPVEKLVEVEKIIEKPVIKRLYRTRYRRNPLEFAAVGVLCLIVGILIGFMI